MPSWCGYPDGHLVRCHPQHDICTCNGTLVKYDKSNWDEKPNWNDKLNWDEKSDTSEKTSLMDIDQPMIFCRSKYF